MIKKFKTIKSLAVFQDFDWDTQVKDTEGNVISFKKINIIYGHNYSGKTTLSRIVRALETGIISPNYITPQFSVEWQDGENSTIADLQGHGKEIRVFNEDFVRENLNFLVNPESKIKAFAVIGAENVKIEKEIDAIKMELGSDEEAKETGLYAQMKFKTNETTKAKLNYKNAYESLEKKKAEKATVGRDSIKQRHIIFGDINYNISKLLQDINAVLLSEYTSINDVKRQELEKNLNETPKVEIAQLTLPKLDFQLFCEKSKEVVARKIGDSGKIPELMREIALNEWVKKGHELHKGKLEICAFCGGKISSDRWAVLEKHFNEETGRLESDISQIIERIKIHKQATKDGFKISKESFYTKFHDDIEKLINQYKTVSEQYCIQLDSIIAQLETRKQTITDDFSFAEPVNHSSDIEDIFCKYEQIRIQSNEYTAQLDKEKKNIQKVLRLNEVKKFVVDIDYESELSKISNLEIIKQKAESDAQMAQEAVAQKLMIIEDLKRKLNDEEKGADKVNKYLSNFFGHAFLKLIAVSDESEGTKKIHFEIMRGEQKAFDLSEGECNLIAFCYFMAKLNDVSTNGKKPIIWIDDPISSLDGNHIFFVYSLLRTEIVENDGFEQLFLSTHNLEFLKYLKRLSGKDGTKDKNQTWLIVERYGEVSTIQEMPMYLKNYVTEFNYLFHQIYKCAKIEKIDDSNYTAFYNFGNNARRFMEIFIAYKYPDAEEDNKSTNKKMKKFFGDDITPEVINRLNNEYSHLMGVFERGGTPVDIPEIYKTAKRIIEKIKESDKEQYDALLQSIKEQDILKDATPYSAPMSGEIEVEGKLHNQQGQRKNAQPPTFPNQPELFI